MRYTRSEAPILITPDNQERIAENERETRRALSEMWTQEVVESQRRAYRQVCPVCALHPTQRLDVEETMRSGEIPLRAVAIQYQVPIQTLLAHAHVCIGHMSPDDADAAAQEFGHEVITGLRRTTIRAEQILNELFDEKIIDEETGETIYPHRSINLALAYNQIAKTHAQTLDGVVAASERKRIAQRLEQLEAAGVTQVQRGRMDQITLTASPATKPRRSVASLLALAPTPTDDPLS